MQLQDHELNEEETRVAYIDPILQKNGFSILGGTMRLEKTAGEIYKINGVEGRLTGRTDYLLCVKPKPNATPLPVAVIEAKRASHTPSHGLQQAKGYAKRFNVPFVYSSNGRQFVQFDAVRQTTADPQPMTTFPTHDQLLKMYQDVQGIDLSAEIAQPLLQNYATNWHEPRYYQDAAIRATLEKIAKQSKVGENPRALLTLATGAGKTFIAVQLVKKLAEAGQATKVLFICDRTELRDQAAGDFQLIFGDNAQIVGDVTGADRDRTKKNARILIATYQTMDGGKADAETNFLTDNYPPNYFTHVIIDECHRSAWGKWSQVLERNKAAVQIGLTATPRTLVTKEANEEARRDAQITADNVAYFGEPVYEYTLTQANEDGYLAVAEVVPHVIDLDQRNLSDEEIAQLKLFDERTGEQLTLEETDLKAQLTRKAFERTLKLPERSRAMAEHFFAQLLATGDPHQKTIIFCTEDHHCDDVVNYLNAAYVNWCNAQGKRPADNYVFKCTDSSNGKQYLPDMRGSANSHFIAVTVKLLDAGVDVKPVVNIAFFVYLNSPITFYQMIGRGTRLYENKLFFRIYDYTNATRLLGEGFLRPPNGERGNGNGEDGGTGEPHEPRQIIRVEGLPAVMIDDETRSIVVEQNGKDAKLPLAEYEARIAERMRVELPTADDFRTLWLDKVARERFVQRLSHAGIPAVYLRQLKRMEAYDLFDVLLATGYAGQPLTRIDRAAHFKAQNAAWLDGMPANTAATLKAIADLFAINGTLALENRELFATPSVARAGGFAAIKAYDSKAFGSAKQRIFAS